MSATSFWYARLKPHCPKHGALLKRLHVTVKEDGVEIDRLFTGGDGVNEVPEWVRVSERQARALARYRQRETEPNSLPAFDLVTAEERAEIDAVEDEMRSRAYGIGGGTLSLEEIRRKLNSMGSGRQAKREYDPSSSEFKPTSLPAAPREAVRKVLDSLVEEEDAAPPAKSADPSTYKEAQPGPKRGRPPGKGRGRAQALAQTKPKADMSEGPLTNDTPGERPPSALQNNARSRLANEQNESFLDGDVPGLGMPGDDLAE